MIFIKGQVPSLKNSKIKTNKGIFHSKTVTKFIRSLGIQSFSSSKKTVKEYVDPDRINQIELLRDDFNNMKRGKEDPIFIGYHFVRQDKRLFDFSNAVEIIQDLFTAHNMIEDDNVKYVFPIPMTIDGKLPSNKTIRKKQFYTIDKNNPGVFIKLF